MCMHLKQLSCWSSSSHLNIAQGLLGRIKVTEATKFSNKVSHIQSWINIFFLGWMAAKVFSKGNWFPKAESYGQHFLPSCRVTMIHCNMKNFQCKLWKEFVLRAEDAFNVVQDVSVTCLTAGHRLSGSFNITMHRGISTVCKKSFASPGGFGRVRWFFANALKLSSDCA